MNAIIVLQGAIPQNKRFKLKDDCPRKLKSLQKKNMQNQLKEEKNSIFVAKKFCLIPTCFHYETNKSLIERKDNLLKADSHCELGLS